MAVAEINRRHDGERIHALGSPVLRDHLLLRARRLLEAIDELLVDGLAVRLRLREIHLADVLRLLRVGDRQAILIRHIDAARIEELDIADKRVNRVELDRTVDDADELLVLIEHWIGDDRDELAARAGDGGRCDAWLLRLAHLLDVAARRTIHIDALVAKGMSVDIGEGEHGEIPALLLLHGSECRLALHSVAVDDSFIVHEPLDRHDAALELLLDLQRRDLTCPLCHVIGIALERRARHIVAHSEKNDKAADEKRQQCQKGLCLEMIDLHE